MSSRPGSSSSALLCAIWLCAIWLYAICLCAATASAQGPIQGLGGRCLDVSGASTAPGTPVIMWDCHGRENQRWTFIADGTIRGHGGMCLTAPRSWQGEGVVMMPCDGSLAQRWSVGGSNALTHSSGLCLDVSGANAARGTNVILWSCHGQPNQQWLGIPGPSVVVVQPPVQPPVRVVPLQPTDGNLIINGDFETPAIADGGWQVIPLPGWGGTSSTGGFEVQAGVAGAPYRGRQLVELDAHAPTALAQDVITQRRVTYRLSLAFSARPGTPAADNRILISIDGRPFARLEADGTNNGQTAWTVWSGFVQGTGRPMRIEIRDEGTPNGLGSYIDDVRLVPANIPGAPPPGPGQ